mmetsp:Transcript_63060/g.186279  ORF Transcript_63060/g.186279 Transcript_63060/m.186279 type:complete len:514 (+) Transcript_63060:189-1730(+)
MEGSVPEEQHRSSFNDYDDFPLNGWGRRPNTKLLSHTRLPNSHRRVASLRRRNAKGCPNRKNELEKASGRPNAKSEIDAKKLKTKRKARAASRRRTACCDSKSEERSPWYFEGDYNDDYFFDFDEDWDDELQTIVHEAVLSRQPLNAIRDLIVEVPDSLLTQDRFGRTPLHCACDSSRSDFAWNWLNGMPPPINISFPVFNELLSACPEAVMVGDKYGRNPLHYICAAVEDKSTDMTNLHPVSLATKAVISACSEAGIMKDEWGNTPLHLLLGSDVARGEGYTDLCSSLIHSNPAMAMIKDGKGVTPLHLAVEGLRLSLVLDMLRLCPEAAMIQTSNSHHSPLLLSLRKNARTAKHAAIVNELIAALVRTGPKLAHDLVKKHPKWCAKLLETASSRRTLCDLYKDDTFAMADLRGMTLVHYACSSHPSADVIQYLLDHHPGGTTEKADFQGNTPLHHAFLSGASVSAKRKLIEQGEGAMGKINAAGMTPLQLGSVEDLFALFRSLPRLCKCTT